MLLSVAYLAFAAVLRLLTRVWGALTWFRVGVPVGVRGVGRPGPVHLEEPLFVLVVLLPGAPAPFAARGAAFLLG
jgi:hypothetical protein